MVAPGPPQFGRGVVVTGDAGLPTELAALADAPTITVDSTAVDPENIDELVRRLHLAWVSRTPHVVRWCIDDAALGTGERHTGPVWALDAEHLFPAERIRFLAFTNNYDARSGEVVWWWQRKAAHAIGGEVGAAGDIVLPDGTAAWIDGGPRLTLPGDTHDLPVIHGETIDLGRSTPEPPPGAFASAELAPDQAEAVTAPAAASRIIAPAGSGKTRTLTSRIRHLVRDRGISTDQLLGVAYNRRAAEELSDRSGLGRHHIRTVHSLGWAVLGEHRPDLRLADERDVRSLIESVIAIPKRPNADTTGPYLEALTSIRSSLRDPADVEAERDDVPGLADAFDELRRRMYDGGKVDHDEQVFGAIEALVTDPELRRRWQHRIRHVLVDEFQDLTPAYLLLIRLVAAPQLQVFGVGDDDQVIYGHVGADPEFLISYDRYFPGASAHQLATNYRCPADVVAAASALLGYNRRRIDKHITPATDAVPSGLRVVPAPSAELAVAAADLVAELLADGVNASDIAVLARVNAALIPAKAALTVRGIATNDLLDRGSISRTTLRALFAWLRLATNPDALRRADVLEAVRRPSRGLTRLSREVVRRSTADLDALEAAAEELDDRRGAKWLDFVDDVRTAVRVAEKGDSAALLDTLIDRIGLAGSAGSLDSGRTIATRSSHGDDLVAIRRCAAVHPGLDGFTRWLGDRVSTPPDAAGVTLSSVHRVKGMEWPHVIVFGADAGAMPHQLSDDREEERRVFHVAITRAKSGAHVLHDAAHPSRFVAELSGTAPADEPPARPSASRLIETAPAADVDPVLATALREWRLETSRTLGVPAFVVMNNRTLDAIAARKPTTERELISVPGIGPSKLESYGDEILALVNGWLELS